MKKENTNGQSQTMVKDMTTGNVTKLLLGFAFSLINGSENTKLNYAVAVLDGIISRIGIAALLGFAIGMGCQGFWYGDALAGFIPIVIGMCYFLSGRWRKR